MSSQQALTFAGDIEQGRRWADYASDEDLPCTLFGVKIVTMWEGSTKISPTSGPVDGEGWQTVTKQRKIPAKVFVNPRRAAWL